jgi:hypothetical protein
MLLTNAGKLKDIQDSEDSVQGAIDLLKGLQDNFKSSGGDAAHDLADIVNLNIGPGNENPPVLTGPYAENAKRSAVGDAVVVLTLAVIGDDIIGDDIELNDLESKGLIVEDGKIKTGSDASDEAKALAAYLNLIASDTTGKYDKNPVTRGIKGAFGL